MKRRMVLPAEEEEDRPPLPLIKGVATTIKLTVKQPRDGFALLLKSVKLLMISRLYQLLFTVMMI
ncbi:unnamed protein product [Linum tenue]|uniref:Uncharacterized protein n=1 Tax=Linum tenue TaxID=586396 RepID=A0AAV0I5C4_9ROSI|nr:unnamed protein product [Linum tenue]